MLEKLRTNPVLKLIVQIVAAILLIVLLWLFGAKLLSILMPFAIAFTIAYILNPMVVWLQKRKIKRFIAVIIIYFIFFGLLFMLFSRLVPAVVAEVNRFSGHIPRYIQQAQELIQEFEDARNHLELPDTVHEVINDGLASLESTLLTTLSRIPEYTTGFARFLFDVFLVLILTFYFLKDFHIIKKGILNAIPANRKHRAYKILREIDQSLGNYIRGQLIICSVIGVSTYLGLLVLGVDFAMMLGVVAGVTNIIPYFGPFIGAFPAVIVALLQSPLMALKVAIVITVIQQVESQLIAPQVLGKRMGMHPLLVIGALIAGGQFFGIIGMVIGVPVVAIIRVLIRNLKNPFGQDAATPGLAKK